MRRHAAALLFAVGALLLTPGAAGLPNVPGDPTPPVVTLVITGTLGDATVGTRPTSRSTGRSPIPSRSSSRRPAANAITFTAIRPATTLTCTAESDGGDDDGREDVQGRQDRAGDDRDTVAFRRLERLVQPRPLRRLQRERHDLRASSRAPRMRPTAGLTRAERRSPGLAATSPGTRHRRRCRSSTTRRRRSRAPRLAHRTRTAGTTTRSPSPSRAPTEPPASPPAPRRPTRGRTIPPSR